MALEPTDSSPYNSRQSWPRSRTFSHDGRYSGTQSSMATSASLVASFPRGGDTGGPGEAGRFHRNSVGSDLNNFGGSPNSRNWYRRDDSHHEQDIESSAVSQVHRQRTNSTDASAQAMAPTTPLTPDSGLATKNSPSTKAMPQQVKVVLVLSFAVLLSTLVWNYREPLAVFFDKEKMQERAVVFLTRLNELPKFRSYMTYAVGFALWETLGLSTIPTETAAGMIFGWDAFYLSSIGKFVGAVLAFCIGRYGFLAEWIQTQLSTNTFLNLVKESTKTSPLQVVLMIKWSCFPETIKNYGSAVLSPIELWMFSLASIIHGCLFSWLWTYLGVDTAHRLLDDSYPTDKVLQVCLLFAGINAFVVTPLAMAAWLRKLRNDITAKPSSDSDTVSTVSSTVDDSEDEEQVELLRTNEKQDV